jgi:hypothetical protein
LHFFTFLYTFWSCKLGNGTAECLKSRVRVHEMGQGRFAGRWSVGGAGIFFTLFDSFMHISAFAVARWCGAVILEMGLGSLLLFWLTNRFAGPRG